MQTRFGLSWPGLILVTIAALAWAAQGAAPAEAHDTPTSVQWNALARELVATNALDPVSASRVYAFVSLAQNDAVAAAQAAAGQDSEGGSAVVRGAVASASVAMLAAFFPDDGERLNALDLGNAGATIGQAVAERVLARARDDGADRSGEAVMPEGPGYWRSTVDRPPLKPYWGQVRPLLMDSVDHFMPEPPPPLESASFRSALAEVRTLSTRLDKQHGELVHFWADGPGTATPAGHWNAIAAELVVAHQLSEQAAARTFALLNIALFDAGVACWKAKFIYWLARPSQMDPEIKPYIAVPNFPSYTSGHATFSGAAAEVLASVFPDAAERLHALAEDAAVSRVYGGIHYPFDSEQGLEVGRRIGRLAVRRNDRPGALLPYLR